MLHNRFKTGLRAPALIGIVAAVGLAPAARADDWKWEITPYAWISDVGLDIRVNETDLASTTVEFGDILDKTDLGALLNFEGRKGRGGLFVDVVYLSFSDDQTRSGGAVIPSGTRTAVELDQLIGEVGGIYSMTEERGLDALFGVRVMDVALDATFDFPTGSLLSDRTRTGDGSLVDGFAGLRYRGDLSDRWNWSIRGDVGGGDTDLTWQGVLSFGAKLGKDRDKTLYLGYRHLAYEFEEGNNGITERDIEYTGPFLGFGFSF